MRPAGGVVTRLVGPRARAVVGLSVLAATLVPIRRDRIGRREQRAFRVLNGLPDRLFRPAWTVMQLGALGAAPATAGAALLAGNRSLATRLATGGTVAWGLAKVVKRVVRRGRPNVLLTGVRCRGQEASGLGYLSGHAAVATALAAAAYPYLGGRGRRVALALASLVGASRIYVGAHLPLDVAGGAALGLLVESASSVSLRRLSPVATRAEPRWPSGAGLCSAPAGPAGRLGALAPRGIR
jgi:undecaprenyl-diphosphatase